jgi:hypothetical protein
MAGIVAVKAQRQADNVARQRLEPGLRAAQDILLPGVIPKWSILAPIFIPCSCGWVSHRKP